MLQIVKDNKVLLFLANSRKCSVSWKKKKVLLFAILFACLFWVGFIFAGGRGGWEIDSLLGYSMNYWVLQRPKSSIKFCVHLRLCKDGRDSEKHELSFTHKNCFGLAQNTVGKWRNCSLEMMPAKRSILPSERRALFQFICCIAVTRWNNENYFYHL